MTLRDCCKEFLESLGDDLSEAPRGPHAEDCVSCRLIWETTRRTVVLYRGSPAPPVPAWLEGRVMRVISERVHGC